MRKFTLFLAALCCAVAAHAVDYTVKFAVNGTVKFSVSLSEGTSAKTVREYGETMREQVVFPNYYTFRKWDQKFAEVTQDVTYNALYIMKDGDLYYQVDEPTETAFVTYEVLYLDNYKNLTGPVTIPVSIRDNSMEFNVTGVGEDAFYGCTGLTSITIPNSVTSIEYGAFQNCRGLTSVTIPNSITSIGMYTFSDCTGLTSVTIPNSVTSIGESTFFGCTGLTSVTIPNSVTKIGYGAFDGCSSLTSVTIPNSVTSIGITAFAGCSSLTGIIIPNSVTSIGNSAFAVCPNLTSIVVEKENTVYDSRNNCNAIIETATNTLIAGCQNTIIPGNITGIDGYAFYGCTGLTSITIPDSVTSIGDYAFAGCDGLTTITCKAINPPALGDYVFLTYVDKTISLYVPAQSVEAYQAAYGWEEFMDNTYPIQDEAIEEVQREPSGQYKGTKVIKGGQLLIERNGKTYNALGAEVQ